MTSYFFGRIAREVGKLALGVWGLVVIWFAVWLLVRWLLPDGDRDAQQATLLGMFTVLIWQRLYRGALAVAALWDDRP